MSDLIIFILTDYEGCFGMKMKSDDLKKNV
jgi:hypothetical protein